MKILLLADHMENGGAETHLYELSRLLFQTGHLVTIFSHGGKIADELFSLGINQEYYGKAPLFKLAKWIRKEKPHIVHAHTRKSAFLCRILLIFIKFPFVFTAHARFSSRPIKKIFSFFPRRTIAVSADIAQHLTQNFGVSPKNISVIGNGINTKRFCSTANTFNTINILTISRLDDDCSLSAQLLCQIAPALSDRFGQLRITIVGGGNQYQKICSLAKLANQKCGKEVVHAVGKKQDVLPYLQRASIFVGVSRAALEAMSCGVPVILSGNEGYLGIAEKTIFPLAEESNFCARDYPKPTENKLFQDICLLLTSPELVQNNIQDGKKQIQKYHTAKSMAKNTLEIYRCAIQDMLCSRKSDILLCGYYGFDNLGDEMTLRSICSALYRSETKHFKTFTSFSPRISVLAKKGASYNRLVSVNRFQPLAVYSAIRHTGVLVLGGGSLLQNKTSHRSLFYYLFLIRLAHWLGVSTMLYASGIGPIDGQISKKSCQKVLSSVDLISVRDEISLSVLQRMGIQKNLFLSADPVLLYRIRPKPPKKYLLAFVRKSETERIFSRLTSVTIPIVFAVMDKHADLKPTQKTAERLKKQGKNVSISLNFSEKNIVSLIQTACFVVSARLHALILAFCAGVPFLGLSDDPKISAFSSMVQTNISENAELDQIRTQFYQRKAYLSELASKDAPRLLELASLGLYTQKNIDKKTEK